jgi:hypothetical protein
MRSYPLSNWPRNRLACLPSRNLKRLMPELEHIRCQREQVLMGTDGPLDQGRFGNKYPAEHLSPCRGANPLAWKVTMSSWFISPWEAVRLSLEAQRLIAVQFFPFGPRRGPTHQEEATRDIKVVVPGLGSSADVPIPPLSRETVRARTVAARSATDVTRKATATRKLKSNKRKRKHNKQRG